MNRTFLFCFISLLCMLTCPVCMQAEQSNTENAKKARELFETCYNRIYGAGGSSFTYNVNIFGLYKTKGHITYKGKKMQYTGDRTLTWKDEKVVYSVKTKNKTVTIWRADDETRDKYGSKFKFTLDEFNYSYTVEKGNYVISAKPKASKTFGISEARVTMTRDCTPIHVLAKVSIIRANIDITDFKSGNISDDVFVYPKEKYKSFEVIDNR